MDTLDPFKFEIMTRRPGHEAVLRSLNAALASSLQSVKLNVVVVKGLNDSEVLDFVEMAQDTDILVHEAIGVVGVACPEERPLLGLVSAVAPLVAMGNTVVAVPSEAHPLAATDFYSVLDTSDVPGGVVNIITGDRDALARVLAEHDDVDAVWYRGTRDGAAAVERASAGNLKRTWTGWDAVDWTDAARAEGRPFLREATQVKNVWVPYGE